MLQKFCEVSSCNGVVDLYESKNNKCQFAFWVMVMTCMLGASVYFTYATIKGYVNTPSVTNVAIVSQTTMDLPEFSIAYNGGMNIPAMLAANLSTDLVKALSSKQVFEPTDDAYKELENYRQSLNLSMQDIFETFSYACEDMVDDFTVSGGADDSYFVNIFCERAIRLWNGAGAFYLFNKNFKQVSVLDFGFKITLNQLPFNFQNIYSTDELISYQLLNVYSISIQKAFNNQTSPEDGILIPLNSYVKIVLNPKRYLHLAKLGKCDIQNETYNSGTCTMNCLQAVSLESCKCLRLQIGSSPMHPQFDYCDLKTSYNCILNETHYDQCAESCLPKCEEWVFEYEYLVSELLPKDTNETLKSLVVIQYNKMVYIKIEEIEAFTMDMAVANVGGQCGLWLGASFVTLVQAVYYLLLGVAEKLAKKKEAKISVAVIKSTKVQNRLNVPN